MSKAVVLSDCEAFKLVTSTHVNVCKSWVVPENQFVDAGCESAVHGSEIRNACGCEV